MANHSVSAAPRTELFHQPIVRDILEKLGGAENTVVIRGIRGSGKSTILRQVRDVRGGTLLTAADPDPGRKLNEIRQAHGAVVCLDDVDVLLDPSRMQRTHSSGIRSLEQQVHELIDYIPLHGGKLIATFSYSSLRLQQEFSEAVSILCQRPSIDLPQPWTSGWKSQVREVLRANLANFSDGRSAMIGGFEVRFTREFLELWIDQVLVLTGGHVTLLGAAECEYIAVSSNCTTDPKSRGVLGRTQSQQLIGDWMGLVLSGEPMTPIRLRVNALRRDRKDRKAIELLANAAESGGRVNLTLAQALGDSIQSVVQHNGLAHYDTNLGELEILGELIRRELLERQRLTPGVLAPDASDPDNRGSVSLGTPGNLKEVHAKGSEWRILRTLYEANGRPVPTAQLRDKAGLGSSDAVRPLVNRLRRTLSSAGIEGAVKNERRRGYYLTINR